jgi:cell division protein FtsN
MLVAAWMFMLGVLVGRGTAPIQFDIDQLQRSLLAKREAAGKEQQDQLAKETQSGTQQTQFGFYEDLRRSDKDDKLNAAAVAKETQGGEKNKTEKASEPTEAAKPLKTPSTVAKEPARKMPPPVNQMPKEARYTIQVASIKDAQPAEEMAARLKKKGYPAYVMRTTVSGKIWYRVRMGGFKDRSEANRLVARLKKEKMSPIVIQR